MNFSGQYSRHNSQLNINRYCVFKNNFTHHFFNSPIEACEENIVTRANSFG